ncbi:MAG TPA: sporulation transcriptional regulator SpoIIID [Clostridia bacterium]|nr:MAG: stage III sporulation protein D [Clostridia bacterium BRH_c25]MBP7073719.1 sporulation transcriptional regulator SpoIIID [Clostridia bacterium]MDD3706314.1 sporulation transcriptional regulator SpoIIID [Clostridiaceae bacterium]NLK36159.1 sporulation transcriptional regulator SpoIIID [Gracilibacteraceae bacterium]HNR05154.1 sporulation transcriptional regulator SpoIIID [Bacillota bacterium]HRU40812.1 sporulation transcriptional regulator SpoIIID [Candidatus Diapherotrites archaeon]
MKDYIEERALEIAKYIISSKTTVRDAAKIFGVSKSTVHKDVTERLPRINPSVALQVKEIMDQNKAERHIRGGRATKMKYQSISL